MMAWVWSPEPWPSASLLQVSDIKRVNGILSDNAMFAREHIKIPTGSVPMR